MDCLPSHNTLYYNGEWHSPLESTFRETYNPGNGEVIGKVAQAGARDVDAAVQSAHLAFETWRDTPPTKRAECLLVAADALLQHAEEFAMIDSLNTGNPYTAMLNDARIAAEGLRYFAGLIPMLQGETIPQGNDTFHYTVREPLGVVARIVAFNHPLMFAASRIAAPLAAGNTVILKSPDQAPLSCLRLAEVLDTIFPPGVVGVLSGGAECGKALSAHPLVKKVTLIGSVATGKAIQQTVAAMLKPTILELGGKNALIAFPDADPAKVAAGIAQGMNFAWAGQSCGSTSRVFLHKSHHDTIVQKAVEIIQRDYKPGVPIGPSTTMGPVISKSAESRVLSYIEAAKREGAKLIIGGKKPDEPQEIQKGFFIEPTIFTNVKPNMIIAREEIFGPVLAVLEWEDVDDVIKQVNLSPLGLTAAIFTRDLGLAHKVARRIDAGFIWINQVGRHFQGVPFGGMKDSGMGREECLSELLAFTEVKSINIGLN
ncbi:hypothetical protein CLAIMM_04690 [Cladophialophora immunda]|nr:hypothetical protein CLAIMM_04690 [Cladophialophora immunda]